MDCANARLKIQERIEGPLSSAEERGLSSHLASCSGCRRERALLSLSAGVLKGLPDRAPRAGFDSRVLAAAAAARRAQALPLWAVAALNAAATATALWMAALAAVARPRIGASTTLAFARALRHPRAAWPAAQLAFARISLSLPESLRAARRAGAVLARIHVAPGSFWSAVPFELAAAALIAGLALAAIARPRPSYAAHRRIP